MQTNAGFRAAIAGSAIPRGRLVKFSSGSTSPFTVALCGSNEQPLGVVEVAADSGAVCTVRLLNVGGTVELTAGEAMSAGAAIYSGANGKVVDTPPGSPVIRGIALAAATADGDLIECLLY